MSPIYLPSKSIWHGRRNNLLVAHNFCAFAYFISFLFSLFARSSSWRNEKKKSTHATLHFPAGSFGLHASRVPSIKHSSQYYSQSSSQSLCGMTVAIFQQGPPPAGKCVEIFHLRLFPNKKGMSPDWFHPLSEWALLAWVVACKIYRTSGGWNTTKFKGKEPENACCAGMMPRFSIDLSTLWAMDPVGGKKIKLS
jgi:hypothetical protein